MRLHVALRGPLLVERPAAVDNLHHDPPKVERERGRRVVPGRRVRLHVLPRHPPPTSPFAPRSLTPSFPHREVHPEPRAGAVEVHRLVYGLDVPRRLRVPQHVQALAGLAAPHASGTVVRGGENAPAFFIPLAAVKNDGGYTIGVTDELAAVDQRRPREAPVDWFDGFISLVVGKSDGVVNGADGPDVDDSEDVSGGEDVPAEFHGVEFVDARDGWMVRLDERPREFSVEARPVAPPVQRARGLSIPGSPRHGIGFVEVGGAPFASSEPRVVEAMAARLLPQGIVASNDLREPAARAGHRAQVLVVQLAEDPPFHLLVQKIEKPRRCSRPRTAVLVDEGVGRLVILLHARFGVVSGGIRGRYRRGRRRGHDVDGHRAAESVARLIMSCFETTPKRSQTS